MLIGGKGLQLSVRESPAKKEKESASRGKKE